MMQAIKGVWFQKSDSFKYLVSFNDRGATPFSQFHPKIGLDSGYRWTSSLYGAMSSEDYKMIRVMLKKLIRATRF